MTNKIGDITLFHGDCLQALPTLADGGVDCVIADLPYGCLNRSNKHAQWDKEIDLDALWAQLLRVCKPNAAIVLFGQGIKFLCPDCLSAVEDADSRVLVRRRLRIGVVVKTHGYSGECSGFDPHIAVVPQIDRRRCPFPESQRPCA